MELIRPFRPVSGALKAGITVLLLLWILPGNMVLHGQSAGETSSLLVVEFKNIEKKLGEPALSVIDRRELLVRQARLFQLSGNIEAAARTWEEAALAEQENRDYRSLLENVRCLMILGELDTAEANARIALLSSQDQIILQDARYLIAQIEIFRSGNPMVLYSLLESADYQNYRPTIYYTFWRIFADEAYKKQLLLEFSNSPEARILRNEEIGVAGITLISAAPRPLWFFYPGREGMTMGTSTPLPRSAAIPAASASGTGGANTGGPRAIQTGLFKSEANARNMASRLNSAGFIASVIQKRGGSATYWMVTIPPGNNANQTILRLKSAGFESFPVF